MAQQGILVIKLSALGDFLLAIAGMQAIRRHHPNAEITLLTTAPYRELAEALGCFDRIWLDPRATLWRLDRLLRLIARLRNARFQRVYDLQRNDRTALYFNLLGRPEWVGKAAGARFRYCPPREPALHVADRLAEQLRLVGIETAGTPDLSALERRSLGFEVPSNAALLVPGGAAHRPEKRWPAERYAELAELLVERSFVPLLLGTATEADAIGQIAAACPQSLDLCGRTGLLDLVPLARQARLAVGNDTGPMHLIAAVGCPCLTLFSAASDPAKIGPRGKNVTILRRPQLGELSLSDVVAALPGV
jgi:ADP-heptose:LPS heptosyltransferase